MTIFSVPNETWFLLLTGLIVGLILGSFTTMLSYRLPRKQSIVSPPSRCPKCNKRLTVRDLVPVFSWLFYRGRCRHCGVPIGVRYLLIELAVTILVTVAFVTFGFSLILAPVVLAIVAATTLAAIRIEKIRK